MKSASCHGPGITAVLYEKEAIKANKNETKKLEKATKDYKKTTDSIASGGASATAFGKAKKDVEELTKETEKATKEKKKWLSTTGGQGVDTSGALDPVNLDKEKGKADMREYLNGLQEVANTNPVKVRVDMPSAKQAANETISSSYFSSPLSEGGSGLSGISLAKTALEEGTKQ